MSKVTIQSYIKGKDGSHLLFNSRKDEPNGGCQENSDTGSGPNIACRSELPIVTDLTKVKWIPKGESVTVAGREIGGMVYVTDAEPTKLGEGMELGACINTNLPVARPSENYDLSKDYYYEHYHYFSPDLRATYLDWLASGRKSKTYKLQCVTIYFAGLQRRFLYDNPDIDEKIEILEEIKRLYQVYRHDFDLERDLRIFRDVAFTLIYPNELTPTINKQKWFPVSLLVGLGCVVARRENITADWAFNWYVCLDQIIRFKAPDDLWEEFVEIFREEFQKAYPNGMPVRGKKSDLEIHYGSAIEDEFYMDFLFKTTDGRIVPDLTRMDLPLSRLYNVAYATEYRLDKYCWFILSNKEQKQSIKAISMLPKCLWEKRLSEEYLKIKKWASKIVDDSNGTVDVRECINRTGGECSNRPTRAEFEIAANILAFLGFGVAQDPRYSLVQPPFSEKVTLFKIEPTKKLAKEPRKVYSNANLAVTTAFWVASRSIQRDSGLSSCEQDVLDNFVESTKQLTTEERNRLNANLKSYIESSPTMKSLTKLLATANSRVKNSVLKLVFALVQANQNPSLQQIKNVEEVYRRLDLDPKQVREELKN